MTAQPDPNYHPQPKGPIDPRPNSPLAPITRAVLGVAVRTFQISCMKPDQWEEGREVAQMLLRQLTETLQQQVQAIAAIQALLDQAEKPLIKSPTDGGRHLMN